MCDQFREFLKNQPSKPILSIGRNVCMFVCVFVCLSHFLTPFKRIFAPTLKIQMSKLFRFLESLREKKWQEVVSDLKTFAHKGCKMAAQKKKSADFFGISATICKG